MKLKLIALALTGLAATAPVHAEITSSASGNGDLFFTVWDKNGTADDFSDDRSYTRDLGIALNDFASAATTPVIAADKETDNFTMNFAADATFNSFLAATANPSTLQWNIAATDSSGRDRALVTAKSVPGIDEMQINTQFRNWSGYADIFLAAVNPLGTHPTETAGSSIATLADGSALASDDIKWGTSWGGALNFDASGMMGDSLNTYLFWEATTTSVGIPGVHEYANAIGTPATWTLANDGNLAYSVAAVPEADTWAMMLAGLGLMGFIARRRLNG